MIQFFEKHRATAAAIVAAVGIGALHGSASGALLQVSPINLFVIAPGKAGAVSLANQSKAPVRLQIRIFRWRQKDGEEVLEPTRDVIANPPSMEIPPEQTYTIRIARIAPAPVGPEESFRLIVDELPAPIDPKGPPQGVSLLLRTSLPVFFNTKDAAPKVAWRLWSKDGKLTLQATNSGTRHIKLINLAIEGPQGRTQFSAAGTSAYVLPGSTLRYQTLASDAPNYAPGTVVKLTTVKGSLFEVVEQLTVSAGP